MNPKLIKKQFEKSYVTYDQNAVVQKYLAQKLVSELLNIKSEFENVLELGCGTGLLTKELVKNVIFKNFFANDIVDKSEKYIRNIIPECKFYCGDARKIKPLQKMDLIISNAMFQWFENLEKASEIYLNMLKKEGILAFTSFSPDNFKEIREITGLSLNYKTFDEMENIFSKNFEILYSEQFEKIVKFSTPLELLAHMKNTGVNSLTSKSWTIKEVKEFCDLYKEKFPHIELTYAGMIMICKL